MASDDVEGKRVEWERRDEGGWDQGHSCSMIPMRAWCGEARHWEDYDGVKLVEKKHVKRCKRPSSIFLHYHAPSQLLCVNHNVATNIINTVVDVIKHHESDEAHILRGTVVLHRLSRDLIVQNVQKQCALQ